MGACTSKHSDVGLSERIFMRNLIIIEQEIEIKTIKLKFMVKSLCLGD